MKMLSKFAVMLVSGAALALGAAGASAQAFPNKPIRILVPFAAGGGTDVMTRLLAQKMTEGLGQPVIVDNKPGSDTIIAAEMLAKSPPDGYTLFMALDMAFTTNPFTYSTLPYDPVKDFAPVSLVGYTALLVVAKSALPVNNAQELVAYARANPGKLNYGSGAIIVQTVVEMVKQTHPGVNMVFIPFKGAAPTVQALMAGDIDVAIADFFSFLPPIRAGKIKAIGVTGTQRDPSLPDVPTMMEQGFTNVDMGNWWALYAPAKTPQAVIDRLNREVARSVALPDYVEKVRGMAIAPMSSTPAELAARQARDTAKLGPLIRAAGIKVQ